VPRPRFHRLLGIAGPTVFYAVLSAWLLWPLPPRAAETVIDTYRLYPLASTQVFADLLLVMWIMAWECHALVTYPARLFSANAFHPVPHSLALSEHFLGNLPWFAPVYAATGNAVLALNVTMFASYVLAGLSMYWLVRAWTGSRAAGLFAGSLFAFSPWRLTAGVGHYHLLTFQYLPLVLLMLDRAGQPGRGVRPAVAAACLLVLQTLCSYYLGYAAFAAAAAFAVVHHLGTPPGERRALPVLLALAGAALALLPISLPYLGRQAAGVVFFEQVRGWREFVWREGTPLALTRRYVSLATLPFALLGLAFCVRGARPARARALGLGAAAGAGFLLSPGPGLAEWPVPPPYAIAQKLVPGLVALRDPTRFGVIVLLGLVGLAGFGAAGLLRAAGPRWRRAAALAVVLLGIGAAWAAASRPYPLREVPTGASIPPVYHWLAANGDGGPLLELPVYERRGFDFRGMLEDARAMYFSTVHWLPLLNGYSGYTPAEYPRLMEAARRLPDPAALATLVRATGLRWILLHRGRSADATVSGLAALPDVRVVGEFDGDVLYEVESDDPQRERLRALGYVE